MPQQRLPRSPRTLLEKTLDATQDVAEKAVEATKQKTMEALDITKEFAHKAAEITKKTVTEAAETTAKVTSRMKGRRSERAAGVELINREPPVDLGISCPCWS